MGELLHLCGELKVGEKIQFQNLQMSWETPHYHRIAILASGNGSNAQNIVEHLHADDLARVVVVLTDNPQAGVIARAKSLGIPCEILLEATWRDGAEMRALLQSYHIDFVVLAGYLRLVPEAVVRHYASRIVNIHPALLPKFGGRGMHGMHVHEAVLAAGEPVSGISIHHVNARYDEGAVIFQAQLAIQPGWTAQDLAAAIHQLEYAHYPAVLTQLLRALSAPHPNSMVKKPHSALISVYHKDGLSEIAHSLHRLGVQLISTGGTASFLRELGLPVSEVADLTDYPSILGGRVKTLHPKVFGGILARRAEAGDVATLEEYAIPEIDVVIVDLYPFEDTVASGAPEADIIEKIDIGGISLIRAAAKNFKDVIVVPSRAHYAEFHQLLEEQGGFTLAQRRKFAAEGFDVSSHYDGHIYSYMSGGQGSLKLSVSHSQVLRYGENPHQSARFFGDLGAFFDQLQGKALSYNNLLDVDAAVNLLADFSDGLPFFAIFKHTNPCGAATGVTLKAAWDRALACDPVSAFGGVLVCNGSLDIDVAQAIDEIFFEVLIADDFTAAALEVLTKKKNRILLRRKSAALPTHTLRTAVNGVLMQEKDSHPIDPAQWVDKTSHKTPEAVYSDILFGEKLGKHLKSNAIAIVAQGQLIGSGAGQTSRVDALQQALAKANANGFPLSGAVLYSDAFFPFKDCAEIAHQAGIHILAEPGGSIRDQETIDYCETHDMSLIFTQYRHFKH
jgi:phosphoribosylaminoimidazolecarboxamide formyltransferase / IMP cyclohydrolase